MKTNDALRSYLLSLSKLLPAYSYIYAVVERHDEVHVLNDHALVRLYEGHPLNRLDIRIAAMPCVLQALKAHPTLSGLDFDVSNNGFTLLTLDKPAERIAAALSDLIYGNKDHLLDVIIL